MTQASSDRSTLAAIARSIPDVPTVVAFFVGLFLISCVFGLAKIVWDIVVPPVNEHLSEYATEHFTADFRQRSIKSVEFFVDGPAVRVTVEDASGSHQIWCKACGNILSLVQVEVEANSGRLQVRASVDQAEVTFEAASEEMRRRMDAALADVDARQRIEKTWRQPTANSQTSEGTPAAP